MRKVEVGLQLRGNQLVTGELSAIVRSDRVNLCSQWLEQSIYGLLYGCCGVALHLLEQAEFRLAFRQANNGLPVVLADNGVGFPIA